MILGATGTARTSAGHVLFAPAHLDVEVAHTKRTMARKILCWLQHYLSLAPLLSRMWELRDNITPYDAAYVALAEQLRATLITCDVRLASAPGAKCTFDVIS